MRRDSRLRPTILRLLGKGRCTHYCCRRCCCQGQHRCLFAHRCRRAGNHPPIAAVEGVNHPLGDRPRRPSSSPHGNPKIPHNWARCSPTLCRNPLLAAVPCGLSSLLSLLPQPPPPHPILRLIVILSSSSSLGLSSPSRPCKPTSQSSRGWQQGSPLGGDHHCHRHCH